jgi:hypothetical protein
MGIILYIIATILWVILTPINWLIVTFKNGLSNDYFKQTATDIDRFGNRNFRALFNVTLRKDNGYKFGDERETISSALGKNKRDKTLTITGKIVCNILDFLDKEHCIKSIKELE